MAPPGHVHQIPDMTFPALSFSEVKNKISTAGEMSVKCVNNTSGDQHLHLSGLVIMFERICGCPAGNKFHNLKKTVVFSPNFLCEIVIFRQLLDTSPIQMTGAYVLLAMTMYGFLTFKYISTHCKKWLSIQRMKTLPRFRFDCWLFRTPRNTLLQTCARQLDTFKAQTKNRLVTDFLAVWVQMLQ